MNPQKSFAHLMIPTIQRVFVRNAMSPKANTLILYLLGDRKKNVRKEKSNVKRVSTAFRPRAQGVDSLGLRPSITDRSFQGKGGTGESSHFRKRNIVGTDFFPIFNPSKFTECIGSFQNLNKILFTEIIAQEVRSLFFLPHGRSRTQRQFNFLIVSY